MFGVGATELVLILVIILVLFGAARIPQLMRGIGQGIKEFKSATKGENDLSESSEAVEEQRIENKNKN